MSKLLQTYGFPIAGLAILGAVWGLTQQKFAPLQAGEQKAVTSPTAEAPTTPTLAAAPSQTQSAQWGTNLTGIRDWSPAVPFVDAFKSSRPWTAPKTKAAKGSEATPAPQGRRRRQEQNASTKIVLDLDAQGWVRSLPNTPAPAKPARKGKNPRPQRPQVKALLLSSLQGRYPGGKYLVLYDGEGTLTYQGDAVKLDTESQPGRDVLLVTPSNRGITLGIAATNPANYLRNIRVIPVGAESTYQSQPFNPEYLQRLKPFSALRFMDWMETNNSEQVTWQNRPTLQSATWMKKGVPVEIMVQLANTLGADPWFCMPHQATDDYVRNFALYVKKHLNPNLKVYVEYSNEVWNGQFGQQKWIKEQALKTSLGAEQTEMQKIMDKFSQRTVQVIGIWDEVFSDQKSRVIGVMGAKANGLEIGKRVLAFAWDKTPRSPQSYGVDAVAIAPYFGSYIGRPDNQTSVSAWTNQPDGGLNTLFKELTQGGQVTKGPEGGGLQQAFKNMAAYKTLADSKGIQLIAYEGGQHLAPVRRVGQNAAIVDLLIKANRDPRMGQLYDQYLAQWQKTGAGLFTHFTDISQPGRFGSWGALTHVQETSSPKYDALLRVTGNR
ncbi:MAG: cellulose-binding protein [Cyanobacteriota bacterium]